MYVYILVYIYIYSARRNHAFSLFSYWKLESAIIRPSAAGRSRREAGPTNLSPIHIKTFMRRSEAGRSRGEAGVCIQDFLPGSHKFNAPPRLLFILLTKTGAEPANPPKEADGMIHLEF